MLSNTKYRLFLKQLPQCVLRFFTETVQRFLQEFCSPGSLHVCAASTAYLHRVSHHFVSSLWSLCILDSCFNSTLAPDWL